VAAIVTGDGQKSIPLITFLIFGIRKWVATYFEQGEESLVLVPRTWSFVKQSKSYSKNCILREIEWTLATAIARTRKVFLGFYTLGRFPYT
jgi:hypothetical protein